MRNVVIIGGGLAGLIASVQLVRAGIPCAVVEKKSYPFHRVCGEYVSNEALPFLTASGLYPRHLDLPQIKFVEFSDLKGRVARLGLDVGGFGISRHTFDHHIYTIAVREGVQFALNTEATGCQFDGEGFTVATGAGKMTAAVVIGAFGKRSRMDVNLNRKFISRRSPFVGVKYHVRTDHAGELISLHNFPGGYCGVCNVDGGMTNLCYITHRDNLKIHGDIAAMEREVLFRNPLLKRVFAGSDFLFDKPEVINEVSFETKSAVEAHILMAGDAAGMITPVCGNGMAIAIHSGKLLGAIVGRFCRGEIDRRTLEENYRRAWAGLFGRRLWFGRKVQGLFGRGDFSAAAVALSRWSPRLASAIVSRTHGSPF